MTRWAEMAAFARKSQKVFMAAIPAFHPGKAVVQDAAVKKAVNHLSHVGPEKAVLFGKAIIVNLFQRFKMVLYTLIILGLLWFARLVNCRCGGHFLFSRHLL
jgi:hypothetical protein